MTDNEFTITERKMLEVLQDGQSHHPKELHKCLWDDQGPVSNVKMHISNLRGKLKSKGMDIVCTVVHRQHKYRLVGLLDNCKMFGTV